MGFSWGFCKSFDFAGTLLLFVLFFFGGGEGRTARGSALHTTPHAFWLHLLVALETVNQRPATCCNMSREHGRERVASRLELEPGVWAANR